MVAEIDKERGRSNLSSAVRLFVLDRVRSQKVGPSRGNGSPELGFMETSIFVTDLAQQFSSAWLQQAGA